MIGSHISVYGEVQGSGFRSWAEEQSKKLNLRISFFLVYETNEFFFNRKELKKSFFIFFRKTCLQLCKF